MGAGMGAMEPESSEVLLAASRTAMLSSDESIVHRIRASIEAVADPAELGRLHVALALAHQGRGEPVASDEATRRAVPLLLSAGLAAEAAFASAMGAVFADQSGDVARGVDLAVDALVLLGDTEHGAQTMRTTHALCGFFARLSAFDLAIDLGQRAFDTAVASDVRPVDGAVYSFGYVAAEGGHVTDDEGRRRDWLDRAATAADWLRHHGWHESSRTMLADGLAADIAHARGERADRDALEAGATHYGDVVPDLVAWHRLVRGTAARRDGDADRAVELLDAALPGLLASADNHCVVRALTERSAARATTGDLTGALDDARELARLTRSWQLDQVGKLAGQVARRVDLVRMGSTLRSDVERLARDVDHDMVTGVRSRHWWERHATDLARRDGWGTVTMLDIDGFKSVNDVHGHLVGDAVLAAFGLLVRSVIGDDAVAARYGGEEFVVVETGTAPGCGGALAERIRVATMEHAWDTIAAGLHVTTSAGVAHGPLASVRDLLVAADLALLEAKRQGRNRVVPADPSADLPG